MLTIVCRTAGCAEVGIDKHSDIRLYPGEAVLCGECGQPCEVTGDAEERTP